MCSVCILVYILCGFWSIQNRRYTLRYTSYTATARHPGIYGQCYMSIDRKYSTQCRTSNFIGNDVSTHDVASHFYIHFNVSASFNEIIHFEKKRQCALLFICSFFFGFVIQADHIWQDRLKSTHSDGCGLWCFCVATFDIAVNIIRLMAAPSTQPEIDKLSRCQINSFLFLCRTICRVLVVYFMNRKQRKISVDFIFHQNYKSSLL